MENGIVFIQAFAEVIGDHFEARTQAAGVELYGCFPEDYPVALVPPGRVRIAHDLADAFVE